MEDGLVSIITSSYNSEQYIARLIESVIAQTYTNWELLITDDCSTDNSRDVIMEYVNKDKRIRLFTQGKNAGAGITRNESIKHAKGRYIAFCDDDDWWLPEKLQLQLDYMTKNNVSMCYSSYYTCDEEANVTGLVVAFKRITYRHILLDDSIGFLTCIIDTKAIGKVYMPSMRRRQDWAYKIELLKRAKEAHGLIQPLAYYSIRNGSLSHNKFSLVKFNLRVYREILGYSAVRAWLVFLFAFFPCYVLKKLRLRIINM